MDTPAIDCEGVCKRFGNKAALDHLDLSVPEGAVHGLLGPNGAGKTTAVRILATLLRPDSGRVRVAGFDVTRQPAQVRARIGLAGQRAAIDEVLSGRQNLVMFGRLCHLPASAARRRAGELLSQFALNEAGARPVREYSGGMRRRLDLAASFVVAPRVLFLDEPTTGLDPRGRIEVWRMILSLAAAGTTVLLTTQYLEEADQLASAITVLAAGRVIAEGTPDELKTMAGGDRIDVTVRASSDVVPAAGLVQARLGTEVLVDQEGRRLSVPVTDRLVALTRIIEALREANIAAEDIAVRRPTLDDAFLHLTGRQPPVAPAVIAGRAAADMLNSAVALAVLTGCGFLAGWQPHRGTARAIAALGLLLLLRFAFLWVGVYLGLRFCQQPEAITAVRTLEFPIGFLGNPFVAVATMPGWLGVIALWNPLSSTVTAARQLFGDPIGANSSWITSHAIVMAVGWPLLLTAVFFPLSLHRYQRLSR